MCTIACPCDVENFDAWVDYHDAADFNADDFVANGTVETWEDCKAIVETEEGTHFANYFDSLLRVMEEDFECQGLC
jgi:hypothetical protein